MDTFDSESRRLSDAVPRGVPDGREVGVCDVGVGGRSQRSEPVPSLRRSARRPATSGWSVGVRRGWRDLQELSRRPQNSPCAALQRRKSGAFGARGASGLGRAQDRQAAEGSGPRSGSGALDGDGDPEAAWGRAGRVWWRPVGLHPLRARAAERVVADGLQGPCGPARRPAASADRARRSLALRRGACGLRQRADRDGQTAAHHRLPPLRPAREADHRQWLALGRRTGQPVHPARGLADRARHQDQPFAALSSADHGQGRALPPQPQSRGAVRSALRRSRRCRTRLRALAQRLQHATAARGARACRAGQPLSAEPARLCRDRRALRIRSRRHRAPCPAGRSRQSARPHRQSPQGLPRQGCRVPANHTGRRLRSRLPHPAHRNRRHPTPRPQPESVHDVSEHLSTLSPVSWERGRTAAAANLLVLD